MTRMKKRLAALLAASACLAAAAGLCEEAHAAEVTQTSCSIVQTGDVYAVHCFAQVHNGTDEVLCLDEGTFDLLNGDQLLSSEEVEALWPYFLSPGEDGYLFDTVTFEPNEDGVVVPSVTGIEYRLTYMPIEAQYAGHILPCEASVEKDGDSLYVVLRVENPGESAAFDPSVCFGLYTQSGALIYADGKTMNGIGIPAGGATYARFYLDGAYVSQWEQYGVTEFTARAKASYRDDAD